MTMSDAALQHRRHAIVMEHMTAENAYEFERCIGAFAHPRYEIMPTGEIWDGHDGVGRLLLENITAFPDFKFEPQTIHHAETSVIVEGRFSGTHRGTWRGLPATGRTIDFPLIIVFRFEADRMVCERTYFDLGTLLRQLGVARDPNSVGGQITTMLNHPVTIATAYLRRLLSR
jgi:steroid delta-isomerase-like uncharacterized protein